ncbi:response regulator [Nocardioides sp.]|uniref:response regulator n=1 Tax=Nocardioides sp. TaxID=35761 RepID=UPI001A2F6613|nr:response regulator [Nocardioides sp.]MBJ7359490.1 response regulator [Nocardioides sp.]
MARVLVADTDKAVRDLVRLRLSAWGHEVVPFADGRSALQAWREDHFDLALMAVDLPRTSGLDVLRAIRATGSADQPTVVLMSDSHRNGEASVAYELGADEFVLKPFTLGFLTSFASALLADTTAGDRDALPA